MQTFVWYGSLREHLRTIRRDKCSNWKKNLELCTVPIGQSFKNNILLNIIRHSYIYTVSVAQVTQRHILQQFDKSYLQLTLAYMMPTKVLHWDMKFKRNIACLIFVECIITLMRSVVWNAGVWMGKFIVIASNSLHEEICFYTSQHSGILLTKHHHLIIEQEMTRSWGFKPCMRKTYRMHPAKTQSKTKNKTKLFARPMECLFK